MTGSPAPIVVVAAVIAHEGRFLVTRRPGGVHLAGLWEFPGGKTHPGESHASALQREIEEELAADIVIGELVFSITHDYDDRTISLFFYRCTLLNAPEPMLGQEMRWVEPGELGTLDFPPADAELIGLLMEQGLSAGPREPDVARPDE